jgi:hypothetical protein
MSAEADIDQTRRALAECFGGFDRLEQLIRAERASPRQGDAMQSLALLERRTRRFLIDGILNALGWDVADPAVIREEARAVSNDKAPLYFDYLGLRASDQAPVLIVEAKGADLEAPKPRRSGSLSAAETALHLARELAIVKGGSGSSKSTSEWLGYLNDLRTYVTSLGTIGRSTLRRVAITSGRWLIIFNNPTDAFVNSGVPDTGAIHFFANTDEMQAGVVRLYALLHRRCLVDDLPLLVSVADALKWLSRDHVTGHLRAVLVSTAKIGARMRQYPARLLYPALAVETEGRWLVVVDYDGAKIEEHIDTDDIAPLLDELQRRGEALEARTRGLIGTDRPAGSIADFPGLPKDSRSDGQGLYEAEPDSLAGRAARTASTKQLVRVVSGVGANSEVIVVTGGSWFYKLSKPAGPECQFHEWRNASAAGVAIDAIAVGYSYASFTSNEQVRHCANGDHHAARSRHCHLEVIETHLCCRACVFQGECWATRPAPVACPDL